MPLKDRAAYNDYMRKYVTARYHRRRTQAIQDLGGRCIDCGSTESLEIDHADRSSKTFDISKGFSGFSDDRLREELSRCVIRCHGCHRTKTTLERGLHVARGTHGTISAYRYCRCDACRAAKRDHTRARRERKRMNTQPTF